MSKAPAEIRAYRSPDGVVVLFPKPLSAWEAVAAAQKANKKC